VLVVALASAAGADDRASPRGPPLDVARIHDDATWIGVPIDTAASLVLALPERFWIQCPRNGSLPQSLDGDGTALQFLNARGGSHSLVWVGSVPLVEARADEKPEARVERAAQDFATHLRAKYARVELGLRDDRVTVERTTLTVGGKRTAAWRTSKHVTPPLTSVSGPDSRLTSECLLFRPEGTERLAYVAVASKSGGTSLDRVVSDVAVRKTADLAALPRLVKLVDIGTAADGRFPVRLLSYESPAGFASTLAAVRLPDELVYAEDRVAADGTVTGTLRFEHVDVASSATLAEATEDERRAVSWGLPSAAVEVPLATDGARARWFHFTGESGGRRYLARRAVLLLDDKAMKITWTTFGDAPLFERDRAALERMLATVRLATRSSSE
jgi:hypothetical protein